jgi:two-component system, OmpR family, sensor histidine kinase KdpD
MEEEHRRPDPDALLKEIKKSEEKKGKLKIFLGYAPGVGKTYSMLTEAHMLKKRGLDVVAGYVETHKRDETNALLNGLEIIPRRKQKYKEIMLEEMDVDAIVKRNPAVVLVDELAHTNIPGSRHPKRYIDVNEILEHGIDVLTTINIQHFESQNDIIEQVTGVKVRETIPDSILNEADEVKLVDIPLDELLLRLKEGKVYVAEQAQRAIENFFRKGNLTALREITLRKVATKIDSELLNYIKSKTIDNPWHVVEKIMACISPGPFSKQIVRKTYNIAYDAGIEWYAVYVSTPKFKNLTRKEQVYLSEALNLAEKLGGKIYTLSGSDVADEIINFARDKNITRILIGKPLKSPFHELLKRSPTSRLMYDQSSFDVQLITPFSEKEDNEINAIKQGEKKITIKNYFFSLLTIIPVTIIVALLEKILFLPSFEIIFIIAPIVSSIFYGFGPAISTSVLSVLTYDFLFVDPRYSFTINRPEHFISLMIFFAVSAVVSHLINQSKNQYSALKMRMESLSLIEDLSKELLNIPLHEEIFKDFEDPGGHRNNIMQMINISVQEEISKIVIKYLGRVVTAERIMMLKDEKNNLRILSKSSSTIRLDEKESVVADWVFNKNLLAGSGTDNLSEASWFFTPLSLPSGGTIGVLGFKINYKDILLEQRNLINTISKLSSIAIANWI